MLSLVRTGEDMGLLKPSNPQAYFYCYANKNYEEEIEAYLEKNFGEVFNLNISASSGCGFKFLSYDSGDIKRLDAWLESHEGWVQTSRRNNFDDLAADVIDLDKYIAGCNRRISFVTGESSIANKKYIYYKINAHKDKVAVRNSNFSNLTALAGTYRFILGDDNIEGGVPIGGSVDYNRIITKSLDGATFDVQSDNATLSGYVIEYKGEEHRSLVRDWGTTGGGWSYSPNLEKLTDNVITTSFEGVFTGIAEVELYLDHESYLAGKEDGFDVKNFCYAGGFEQVVPGDSATLTLTFYNDGALVHTYALNFNTLSSITLDNGYFTKIEINDRVDKIRIAVDGAPLTEEMTFRCFDMFFTL